MNSNQDADPDFVKALEWQLRSNLRHNGVVSRTPHRLRLTWSKVVASVALVAGSMFLGAAGTYAVTHEDDRAARELLIAKIQAQLEIAEMLHAHHAQALAEKQPLAEKGYIGESEIRRLELPLVSSESEIQRRRLELEEVSISGREPNNALSAPLVGGRDFVTARLQTEERPIERQLAIAAKELDRLRRLAKSAFVMDYEVDVAEARFQQIAAGLDELRRRQSLRTRFLSAELTPKEVELRDLQEQARTARQAAVRQLPVVAEQLARLGRLFENGAVDRAEVSEMEIALQSLKAQIRLAELELQIIQRRLSGSNDE
ncbi:MAG: hypothetical protein IIB58_12975 [Planctomycetes bacterium]|nr:hypothetical protein [Planctomycetota bacterium]